MKGHNARINDIKFNPNDNLLATASFDGTTKIWQIANLNIEPIILKDHESWVLSLEFSDDGLDLITACVDSRIKRWNVHSELMAQKLKSKLGRDMTAGEWNTYVGKDIPYEKTTEQSP